jgi:hypothetical protein
MNRYHLAFGAGAVCVLASTLGRRSLNAASAACPALKVSYLGIEPHEDDVRWIVAEGAPCRLRFALHAATVSPSVIRYEINQLPKLGRMSIDELGVVYDVTPNSGPVTFSLMANVPGAPPVRSVFKVSPSRT